MFPGTSHGGLVYTTHISSVVVCTPSEREFTIAGLSVETVGSTSCTSTIIPILTMTAATFGAPTKQATLTTATSEGILSVGIFSTSVGSSQAGVSATKSRQHVGSYIWAMVTTDLYSLVSASPWIKLIGNFTTPSPARRTMPPIG